ncbi:hypothetical protein OCF84_21450 (plasmid) [Shewanella xiamenensis]|uniref:Uncharacterized protein n=1 Tax=Shewanella xiamenensis TaxID=332186 RepID=A0ABT6UF42_9GAMM|nr:hypothetical protein [Shewanella xiamenensis]MDI5832557.1 hypothetical protein [Shewanella xiamenensis]WHF57825.1 hypothetical protein OCF84_21450 [Shewanella xiamenensis]
MSNMISTLRQRVIEHGEATLSVEDFNQLQSEWIKRTIPDHLLKAQQVIGIEKVVDMFGFDNLHAPFEVTPDQLYNLCDEIYGGDSQHVRAVPKSI